MNLPKHPLLNYPVNLNPGKLVPLLALWLAFAAPASASQTVPRTLPETATKLEPVDRLPASRTLKLAVSLPLRNREALTNLLEELYNPSSPQYRHFLSSTQFVQRFGPSEEDYAAVADFMKAHGLKVTATSPNRVILDVEGAVSDIEKTLHVNLRVYNHPTESRTFYAPDADLTLDSDVPVLAIHGLNNFYVPKPLFHKQPLLKSVPSAGSGSGGTYLGYDFRDAYLPGVTLTGAGQIVGLFELDGYFPNDPVQYEALAGLPNIPLQNVLLDGFNGAPGFGNTEVSLDIEMAMAMAPGLSEIIVYEGYIPLDVINRIATDDLAKQIGCSWGWFPLDPATDQTFQEMGAQGQTFFHASGDSCAMLPPIVPPSDDPYVTQVGGTTLTTSGPGGSWVSEKVWNWGGGEGSSGGSSQTYKIPSWQQGIDMSTNGGSTVYRNFPDVAWTADNILVVADNGQQEDVGGTSCAAPLWAGLTALVNEQAVEGNSPTMGFLNPAIYSLCKSPNYSATFHDITEGNDTNYISPNLYYAYPGYDLCTGWGTPNGTNLINALTPPVNGPVLEISTNFIYGGNNNGIIEYDECFNMTIILGNSGTAEATGVSATLFTSTPGVAIAQANSSYDNIPVGGTATNLTAFKVSTTAAFNCGVPVHFTLIVKSAQNTSALQFRMASGVPGTPVQFSTVTPVPVPAGGTTNSSLLVSNINFALNKVTVSMYLSALLDDSLVLTLVAPDGTTNVLSANNGANGQDYGYSCAPTNQECAFDDAASQSITSALAPFVGAFQPQNPLAIFAGKAGTNINGYWQLQVQDQYGIGGTVIECWSLFITPTACFDGGGECPGANLAIGMSASPEPVTVGNNLTYSIMVTNFGPSSASNVLVSQIMPGSVSYVSGTSSQGSVTPAQGIVSGNLGLLRPGKTAAMTVVVNTETPGTISSTATVTSEQPNFDPAAALATAVSLVNPQMADLAASMSASPSSAVVGGSVNFNVTVVNNGPNNASGVVLTNILPAGLDILSAVASQGAVTVSGNVVTCTLGTILAGSQATATVNATPSAQGTFTASATVGGAPQPDPNPSNNSSTATVIVGPSADLGLSLASIPNPVISGSNLQYTVTLNNLGPSTATGVGAVLNLPAGVQLVQCSNSQGYGFLTNISGGTVSMTNGTLSLGASASLVVTVKTNLAGTNSVRLIASASASSAVFDPNIANNSSSVTNTVAEPFVLIVPAPQGAYLYYQSGPTNGVVNPGETVGVQLSLENIGNIGISNVSATLTASNGVTPMAPATVIYSNLPPISASNGSNAPTSGNFTFTAPASGTMFTAVLLLQHAGTNLGTANFTFNFPSFASFANTNPILIPNPVYGSQEGPASPYPSQIIVSGLSNLVGDVSVTVSNFYHTYPRDVSLLVVAPGGQSVLVMSHAGTEASTNATLTFDDAAANPVPQFGGLTSGEYQPMAYTPPATPVFSNPAPANFSFALSTFNGLNPNGTWLLYALDDSKGDAGGIANGWSLGFTTLEIVNQTAQVAVSGTASPNPCVAGTPLTYTFTITNGGPDTAAMVSFANNLPASVSLTSVTTNSNWQSVSTNATGVFGTITNLVPGSTTTITIVVTPGVNAVGTLNDTATIAPESGLIDLNTASETATVTSSVILPIADLGVSLATSTNSILIGSNLTYTVTVTNNGPQNALNVVVSDSLPAGLAFVSASVSAYEGGTASNVAGTVIANLGTLPPGSNGVVTVVAKTSVAGNVTNTVTAATASSDTNQANNSASAVVNVFVPMPNIIAAGARILSKSVGSNNGAVGPGDVLTMSLNLENIGSASTTNLTATLLSGNGVTPSGSQTAPYGALSWGGGSMAKNFTFTANGTNGGSVTATLQLSDGANTNFAPVSFTFYLPATFTFSNSFVITIPDSGPGSPYPSPINVNVTNASGGMALITNATATFYRFSHTFPSDVNALLAAPFGNYVLLMNKAGSGDGVSGVTMTFSDAAAAYLPQLAAITNGVYKPTAYQATNLPVPAPAEPYGNMLANFNDGNPNGTWSLYVSHDNLTGDAGEIAGGWSLTLSVIYPVNPLPASLSGLVSGGHFHLTLNGQPNQTYVIQAATNLAGNTVWLPISTNTATSSGSISIVDSNSFKYRFYRAVQLP